MIHLDTNLLIDLVTITSPHIAVIRLWLEEGEELVVSAIVWSEFLNGPHTRPQKDAVYAILEGRLIHQPRRPSRLHDYFITQAANVARTLIA